MSKPDSEESNRKKFQEIKPIFYMKGISSVNNLAVCPASLMHKNRRGRTKSVNVRPSGHTSCKIYMVDTKLVLRTNVNPQFPTLHSEHAIGYSSGVSPSLHSSPENPLNYHVG